MATSEELVNNWQKAVRRKNRAIIELEEADRNIQEAENRLGMLLDPGDMKLDETMCVWVRIGRKMERCVEVTKKGLEIFKVRFRGEPREPESW